MKNHPHVRPGRRFKLLLFCFFVLRLSPHLFSQTVTTFDYRTVGSALSTASCNVFYPTVNVLGANHTSVSHAPIFNSGVAVSLLSDASTSSGLFIGTSYGINYYFDPGYTYAFEVLFSYKVNSGQSVFQLATASSLPSTSSASGCFGGPVYSSTYSFGSSSFLTYPMTSTGGSYVTTSVLVPGFVSWGGNYLLVGTQPNASNENGAVSVTSISISKFPKILPEINTTCNSSEVLSISTSNPVVWSLSPASTSVASITPSGSSVTVTKLTDGDVTLTATVTEPNGNVSSTSTSFHMGAPAPVTAVLMDNTDVSTGNVCYHSTGILTANPPVIEVGVTYEWSLPSDWISLETYTNSASSADYIMGVAPGTDGHVYVRRLNACGYSSFFDAFVGFDPYCRSFKIGPNPARNTISINGDETKKNIREVRLVDKTGRVKKTMKYVNNTRRVNLDISGLAPDIYYLKIFDGKTWSSKSIVVN